jgi:hypothetical protein
MRRPIQICLVFLALFTSATAAYGAPINDRAGPIILGQNAHEGSLQLLLDDATVSGGIDVIADQTKAAIFTSIGGESVASFLLEVAGYADGNRFGIYEQGDTSNRAQIFGGADTPASQVLVSFTSGDVYVNGAMAAAGFGEYFGFYIETKVGELFFSEDDQNADGAQAVIYEGSADAPTLLEVGPSSNRKQVEFGAHDVLVAFEDLRLGHSDRDYQDLVVLVSDVRAAAPVYATPEPRAALFFGIGVMLLSGSGALRGRR